MWYGQSKNVQICKFIFSISNTHRNVAMLKGITQTLENTGKKKKQREFVVIFTDKQFSTVQNITDL